MTEAIATLSSRSGRRDLRRWPPHALTRPHARRYCTRIEDADLAYGTPGSSDDRAGGEGTRALVSVVRALALLDAVAEHPTPVRVADLARRLGVRRPRVHQQLVTLVEAGWMERLPGGAYRLSLRALHVGQAALRQASIGDRLQPVMERLMHEVGEVVSLAVRDGDAAVLVQRVEPNQPLSANYRVGTRLSLDTSASGRAVIAFADEEERARLRAQGTALPDADDIDGIRRAGYALATDAGVDGLDAIAVPLLSDEGPRVIALSVAGPMTRFDARASAPAVMRAAEEMQRLLVGSGTPGERPRGT
jgi:DNA-binding IclR family transcriptional regulator